MKRERPSSIPVGAQLAAAERQLAERFAGTPLTIVFTSGTRRLKVILDLLFDGAKTHCDHNPALILRAYNPRIKNVAERYTPNANDPAYLVHRTVQDHHLKTNVRGDGAQRSDTAERMHQRRMDENRGKRKRRPKAKIARPKNFKWPSRPFQKRRKD